MCEREQLVAAVLREPGEDTPRLVLADWLDEWGTDGDRARAACIRLQVERVRRGPDAPVGTDERELFARWAFEWLPSFTGETRSHLRAESPQDALAVVRAISDATEMIHFGRGFPAHYALAGWDGRAPQRFAERAAELFAVAPIERFELEVYHCEPWVEVWVGSAGGTWRAEMHVRGGGPSPGPMDELTAPNRGALAAGLEGWVLRALADVCFEIGDETNGSPRRVAHLVTAA